MQQNSFAIRHIDLNMIKLLGYETVKTMQKYNDNRAIPFVLQSNQIMYN